MLKTLIFFFKKTTIFFYKKLNLPKNNTFMFSDSIFIKFLNQKISYFIKKNSQFFFFKCFNYKFIKYFTNKITSFKFFIINSIDYNLFFIKNKLKKKMQFFDQAELFKKNMKISIKKFSTIFAPLLTRNKFFFKKLKYINNLSNNYIVNTESFIKQFFRFFNFETYCGNISFFFNACLVNNCNMFSVKNYYLSEGDIVKFSINKFFIIYFFFSILLKYNFLIYKKFKNISNINKNVLNSK